MKNKILKIKGCKTCKEVLIARIRIDDTGEEGVELSAWHESQDGVMYYQYEIIEFTGHSDNQLMADRYVQDFTAVSALAFANSYSF